MLSLQPARTRRRSAARIGLAIAGGGPIGGMYELGALRALDEALDGIDMNRLDVYVGVSSGAFLAAGLANRMSTAEMCRIFILGDDDDVRFRPEMFMRPAFGEYGRRAAGLPRIVLGWWKDLLTQTGDARLPDVLNRIGGLIPTGLFDNAGVETFLREVFSGRGRSNDFRTLDRKLYVVAVDLDNGEAVRFGAEDWDDIPISRAVQASAALPGLYSPVTIRGRHFVDGVLRRTLHASVVMDHGVDLMIGVNPLVPFDSGRASRDGGDPEKLAAGGLPAVLSQTLRTLLQSRAHVGLARYAQQYPQIDQLVLEPNATDGEMFFTSPFSYASRQRVCEHAYRSTLADLRLRKDALAPVLARHGIRLRADVLNDTARTLMDGLASPTRPTETTARLRRALDDVALVVQRRRDAAAANAGDALV